MNRPIVAIVVVAPVLAIACGGGTEPDPNPPEPSLAILSIGPSAIRLDQGPLFLLVHGRGFKDGAVVERDTVALETTYISDTDIGAVIGRDDVAIADTSAIRVRNPDGETSNAVSFIVSPDANPLHVVSIAPAHLSEVNADTSVTLTFSEPIDTASLVDTSLVVRDETGTVVSGSYTYDAAGPRLHWTGALAPVHRYTVSLSSETWTAAGGAVDGTLAWTFTTTLGSTVLISPLGAWPTLVLGTDSRPRVAFHGQAGPTDPSLIKFATCSGTCVSGWSIAEVGGLPGPTYLSLATDGHNQFSLAFQDPNSDGAAFATTAGATDVFDTDAAFTSIGAAGTGRQHVLYYHSGTLRAGSCAASCTSAANWTITDVDTAGNAGSFPSVAVDPLGGVHVTYFANTPGDLRYAECAAPCTAASWITGVVDTVGRVGFGSSLLVDPTGRLHATWIDVTAGDVVYGTCAAACITVAGWSRTVVEHIASDPFNFGFDYPSLALGPNGFELAYETVDSGLLRGASCAANCTTTDGWTTFTVSLRGATGIGDRRTSLKVDPAGKRHLAWTDGAGGVRYTQY